MYNIHHFCFVVSICLCIIYITFIFLCLCYDRREIDVGRGYREHKGPTSQAGTRLEGERDRATGD